PAAGEAAAFPGDELPHDVRDEDLAAVRLRGDAGGDDDGGPVEVAAPARVVFGDRLAGLEADADADIAIRKRPLDGDGAPERLCCGAKRGHEAVAHRLDLAASVSLQCFSSDALMLAQYIARGSVAHPVCEGGRAFDVCEKDGLESARGSGRGTGSRCLRGPAHELAYGRAQVAGGYAER